MCGKIVVKKFKFFQIGAKIGVVVDIDPVIIIVVCSSNL